MLHAVQTVADFVGSVFRGGGAGNQRRAGRFFERAEPLHNYSVYFSRMYVFVAVVKWPSGSSVVVAAARGILWCLSLVCKARTRCSVCDSMYAMP